MRVVVVGCGAMGSSYAAALVRGGHDVEVLEANPRVVDLLGDGGVTVVEPGGAEHALRLAATLDPADVAPGPDVLLVFVKAYDGAAAARAAAPLVGPDTIVATVQNGWGHGELLAEHVPTERLVVGVTFEAANAPTPDRVIHYANGPTQLGPWRPGSGVDAAEAVAALLRTGGLQATALADARPEIWEKLVFNAAYSAVPTITGLSLPGVAARPDAWALCSALVDEAVAVAALEGIELDAAGIVAKAAGLAETSKGTGGGKPSMLLDVEARRPTEVAVINGAVVAAAERHAADAPLHRAALALIGGIEASWRV